MQKADDFTLNKGFEINGFTILFPIKKGSNAESYRVKDNNGDVYFLKIFNYSKLSPTAFDSENNVFEIEFLKKIDHPNIVSYKFSGDLIFNGKKFGFLVLDFIVGETLADRIARETIATIYDIKQIGIEVLTGLNYLHNLPEPIIHNEITPSNIMLDLSGEIAVAKIIDFGHARSFYQSSKMYNKVGLNLNYIASECFNNIYSPQSDLFSVGAILYYLVFGIPPWFKDLSKYETDILKMEEVVLQKRKKPLSSPNINFVDFDESILNVIKIALSYDTNIRFQSANYFIQAINDQYEFEKIVEPVVDNLTKSKRMLPEKGKGFSAIAGMNQLKQQLHDDVINVIENPDEYKKHNLGLPNGMLLYGPPGCGKTFFAERFAEEAGYYFIKVVSSDISSIYIHGSQEKIGKLFNNARAKAPTILYFDELDAMVPNRENVNNQSQSSEVNEFLSQLDNIGESGVFVIGSTNKPDAIDKAVLRAGRLEKWYYIPPPDFEARKALFELYLKKRPLDFGIDYDRLALLTENYVSSDIKLLIDEASRKTIRDKTKRVTMQILEVIIKNQRPTVSLSELKKYESIRKKIEQDIEDIHDNRTRIGFNLSNNRRND